MATNVYMIATDRTPYSFNTLEADRFCNLQMMRMLYAPPVEFDAQGNFKSALLSQFEFDALKNEIRFRMKPSVFYSNGDPIRIDDVALSIKRKLLAEPESHNLSLIVGFSEWLASKAPLRTALQGLVVGADGETLTIQFSEEVKNPLFEFTFEEMGVVSAKCIDLDTNRLSCERPPESGPYKLIEGNLGEKKWVFEARRDDVAKRITFLYGNSAQLASDFIREKPYFENRALVVGPTFFASGGEENQALAKLDRFSTAPTWLVGFVFNPEKEPFNNPLVRQYLSGEVKKRLWSKNPSSEFNRSSIFPELSPGYIEDDFKPTLSQSDISRARALLPKTLVFLNMRLEKSELDRSIEAVCLDNNIVFKSFEQGSQEALKAFKDKKFDAVVLSIGWWPYDIAEDIRRVFTTSQATEIKLIRTGSSGVKHEIAGLFSKRDPVKDSLVRLNREIQMDAIYNVFLHAPLRVYYSRKDLGALRLPVAGTIPYPWMYF